MTVIVTNNVADRFRGFISSCMLEIAPGVYTSSNMNAGVRERLWKVIEKWYYDLSEEGSIVMTWSDSSVAVGQRVRVLGVPPVELIKHEGIILTYRELTESEKDENAVTKHDSTC